MAMTERELELKLTILLSLSIQCVSLRVTCFCCSGVIILANRPCQNAIDVFCEFMGEKYCCWGKPQDTRYIVRIHSCWDWRVFDATCEHEFFGFRSAQSCLSLLSRYICRIFAIQRTQDNHIYITCSCSREKGWTMWWTASSKHENSYQEANMLTFEPVQLKSSVLLSLWQS